MGRCQDASEGWVYRCLLVASDASICGEQLKMDGKQVLPSNTRYVSTVLPSRGAANYSGRNFRAWGLPDKHDEGEEMITFAAPSESGYQCDPKAARNVTRLEAKMIRQAEIR